MIDNKSSTTLLASRNKLALENVMILNIKKGVDRLIDTKRDTL